MWVGMQYMCGGAEGVRVPKSHKGRRRAMQRRACVA
jgi:hypothetical protein